MIGLLILLVAGLLIYLRFNSYQVALPAEKTYLPDIHTLATPHRREESFHWLNTNWDRPMFPHWEIIYREDPITHVDNQDPAVWVSLFGEVLGGSTKEISLQIETDKR